MRSASELRKMDHTKKKRVPGFENIADILQSMKFTMIRDSQIFLGKKGVELIILGGLGKTGSRASCVLYHKSTHKAIMIDCGINVSAMDKIRDNSFSLKDLPDFSWFDRTSRRDGEVDLMAIVLTHAHLDHIGGLSYFLTEYYLNRAKAPPMICGGRFTCDYIRFDLYNNIPDLSFSFGLQIEPLEYELTLGPFRILAIPMPHSIPDNLALAVICDNLKLVFSSDFKLRNLSPEEDVATLKALAPFHHPDFMLCDATNAERPGYASTELDVIAGIRKVIEQAPGRVIITFFSTNLMRLRMLYGLCLELGKTFGFLGTSFKRTITAANEPMLNKLLSLRNHHLADVICVTGCQANEDTVAIRLSRGESVYGLQVKPRDTMIISANPIPGRQISERGMINGFYRLGVEIYVDYDYPEPISYVKREVVHATGHACAEDLKAELKTVNPKKLLPYHCNSQQAIELTKLALTVGIKLNDILLSSPHEGETVEIDL